jgi:hypothetical protein
MVYFNWAFDQLNSMPKVLSPLQCQDCSKKCKKVDLFTKCCKSRFLGGICLDLWDWLGLDYSFVA